MPISDDLNKRLQFARMPARNVNYITCGAPARNVSFHGSVECDVLSVAGETRDSSRGERKGKKKRIFSGKCGRKYAFEIAANLMQAWYREIRFDTKWMQLLPDL